MRCYLCGNTKSLSEYRVDGDSRVFVCQDCEEELLFENCIDLEDKICEKTIPDTHAIVFQAATRPARQTI